MAAARSGLAAGDHMLTLRLEAPGDREKRDDVRLHLLTVAATPGIVLLATPGDWDSRFLFRALRDVAELPVRGYVQVQPGAWRSMRDLSPASTADVRRAAERADLLVLKGSAGALE